MHAIFKKHNALKIIVYIEGVIKRPLKVVLKIVEIVFWVFFGSMQGLKWEKVFSVDMQMSGKKVMNNFNK